MKPARSRRVDTGKYILQLRGDDKVTFYCFFFFTQMKHELDQCQVCRCRRLHMLKAMGGGGVGGLLIKYMYMCRSVLISESADSAKLCQEKVLHFYNTISILQSKFTWIFCYKNKYISGQMWRFSLEQFFTVLLFSVYSCLCACAGGICWLILLLVIVEHSI